LHGKIKLTPAQDKLIVPISIDKRGDELSFLIIDIDTGNNQIINTGLKSLGGLSWIANKNWLVLNGILLEKEVSIGSIERGIVNSKIWKINIGNQTKQKLTDNTRSLDGFWITEKVR